jgi:hypothetical protein
MAGPPGCSTSCFPAASFHDELGFGGSGCGSKSSGASVACMGRYLNSPVTYVPISGVGTDVPRGDLLYFRSDGPVDLQITTDDGTGEEVVVEESMQGLYVREFPSTKPLLALAVRGNARIAYLVSGPG